MAQVDYNLTSANNGAPRDVMLVAVVNPDGSTISGGGGGLPMAVQDNQVATILNELNTDFGIPAQDAWSGTGDGTVISILKALYAQNAAAIALLTEIRDNTATP